MRMLAVAMGAVAALSAPLPADDSPTNEELKTPAERSEFRATARYDEVQALLKRLAARSKLAHLGELGQTVEGRSIPVLILANPPVATPQDAARSGKPVVLVLGNIHAGEVDGKEALPILAREILAQADPPLLKELILAFVPIYNADGNERVSKDNRPGQVGPEEGMGQRTNARGLNLNRDFIKLEAPETRALVRFLNRWDPALVIDTHTTNGSNHRYTITYEGPKNPAGDPAILNASRANVLPAIARAFHDSTGLNAYLYGNFDPDHTKWTTYPATGRFGTTYVGLRNRFSILSEAYAYAPYKTRVLATRDYVRACLEYAAAHRNELQQLLDQARERTVAAGRARGQRDLVAIRSKVRPFPEPVTVLGFVEREEDGVATDVPKEYEVKLEQDFVPTESVRRPYAYLVPGRYKTAIETLQRHGIELAVLREDLELDLEAYTVTKLDRAEQAFEGHHTTQAEVEPRTVSERVPAGTCLVRTAQPLGTLAVYLLEPHSDDGLTAWNFFDEGLAAGKDFPVLRLLDPVPMLTTHARPLPEDRPPARAITFEALYGEGPRPDFNGSPTSPRWLDDDHFLQQKEGATYRVDATTGRSQATEDRGPLVKALAGLPTIGRSAAESLVRGGGGGRPAGRRGFRGRGGAGGSLHTDPQHKGALFEYENDLYYATLDGERAVRLTNTPAREELATFSPDGAFVAFVRANDLYVVDVATQTERALTTGGTESLLHGKADWVYFEEIFNRNSQAYWWSPDSKRIALLEFDDSPVQPHAVVRDADTKRVLEQTPYPRVGEPNPNVRLGLVTVAGGPVRWADLASYLAGSILISEVGWWPDGNAAYLYVQDRTQTWLDVLKMPASGGAPQRLFRETTGAWVESLGKPWFLDDGTFLVTSERSGWKHLYHFDESGLLKRQVTSGEWEVRTVHRVDPASGWIYLSGTRDGSLNLHLYRVKLDGSALERLTSLPGVHQVELSPGGKYFIDRWSNSSTPTRVALYQADGRLVRTLDTNPVPDLDAYRFAPRELVQVETKDGFTLEGELITPPNLDRTKRYPVWFTTYGGPHFPSVSNSWAEGRTWEQMLAQEGVIVFRVDPRSASGKGAVSAWAAYRQLGIQELKDITAAIEWLKARPYVDGSRIGISGHSYGGFMAAFAMTHSDLFAAGIAGAPVTDWHDYDSIYTERYMSTPQDNPAGYAATSAVEAARNLHGRLLILHGAIDDNVSVRNTLRLVNALQQANKDFELMLYPASRHGIFGAHYIRLQVEFIRRALKLGNSGEPKSLAE